MKYLGSTRRFYKFEIDRDLHFIDHDVICEGNQIKFYRPDPQNKGKRTFDTPGECIDFFNKKVNKMEPIMDGVERKSLDFNKVTMTKTVSGAEWKMIQPHLPEGSSKNKDDFTLFTDYLANNWKDRDKERFPKNPSLNRFAKTIVGRQKLISHQWGSYGIGRYFKSALVKHTPEEVIELMHNSHPNPKFLDHLKLIEEIDGGLFWLVAPFFVPNHKYEAIEDLESGIPNSSIGFLGMIRRPYVKEKTDKVLWTDLVPGGDEEDGEAVEGSLVGVESQFGAGAKSFGGFGSGKKSDDDYDETLGILIPYGEVAKIADNKDMHYFELSPVDDYSMISKENTDNDEGIFYDVFYGYKDNKREIQSLAYPKKHWTKGKATEHSKEITASLKDPANNPQPRDSGAGKTTKKKPKNDGGFYMKFFIEALGFTKDSEIEDQKGLDKVLESINEAVVEKVTSDVKDAETAVREEMETEKEEAIKVYVDTLELKDVKPEDLEQHLKDLAERAKNGVTAQETTVEEIVKFKINLGLVENEKDDLKAERETLNALSMDDLTRLRDQFKAKFEKDNPGKSQLNGDPDPEEEKKTIPKAPARSFQEVT